MSAEREEKKIQDKIFEMGIDCLPHTPSPPSI